MKQTKVKKPTQNKKQSGTKQRKSHIAKDHHTNSFIKKVVVFVFAFTIVFIIAAIGTGIFIYNSQTLYVEKLESTTKTAIVLSNSGTLIEDLTEFKPVEIDSVPVHTRWAFICTEDKNFYEHSGFSIPRIVKATFNNISSGYTREGASTISQQLIKNTHLSHEKTFQRKLREVALAHKLEQRFTKDQILEMYFNAIYFGNGLYGLEQASRYYFGKPAAELSIRESSGLAGLIRNPLHYCPISNFDSFCDRSDMVLDLMYNQKKITKVQYDQAKSTTPCIVANTTDKAGTNNYKIAAVAEAARIMGTTTADISRNEYKIHTYYDAEIQKHIDIAANANDYQIKNVSGNVADKCIIAARPNGEIVAYYASSPVLRNAKRNFASALKPLVVYAPAFELGVVTPATIIADEPFVAGDFNPRNHDGKHHGNVSVRNALEQSYNIPAVKVLDYTRLTRAVDIANNLGLDLTDEENISVALGNTKNGTAFTEMIAGYCTLANSGTKTNPSFIKKITDKNGITVYENAKTNIKVLGEDTAFLLTDILRTGTKTGTAKSLESLPFEIAAKTGTCERINSGGTNTDAVNCSLTTDYVLLVWAGNTDMKPENDLPQGTTGGGITSFIARNIQSSISKNAKNFPVPDSIGVHEKTKEYFAKRYKDVYEAHTQDFLKAISPIIDGFIGGAGAPVIQFNAQAHQIYEIYKDGTLQEIIQNHSGEYNYTDTRATKDKTYSYHVVTYLKDTSKTSVTYPNTLEPTEPQERLQSNTIKLYTSNDINKNSALLNPPKTGKTKQWFF